jgi:hypothetical protein
MIWRIVPVFDVRGLMFEIECIITRSLLTFHTIVSLLKEFCFLVIGLLVDIRKP